MAGDNLGQVLALETGVLQPPVNLVRLELETTMAWYFFAQITNQEIGERRLTRLGVINEQAVPLLGFKAALDVIGLGFAVGNQSLVRIGHAARANDEVIIEARQLLV